MEVSVGIWLRICALWFLVFMSFSNASLAKSNIGRKLKLGAPDHQSSLEIQLRRIDDRHVVMDNGIVQVTLSIPDGNVVEIKYNGIDDVLEVSNKEYDRGYWDVVWDNPGEHNSHIDRLSCTEYKVIVEEKNHVEISFTKTWKVLGSGDSAPINVDKRFIMLPGLSGFYTYAIFERPQGWPDVDMDQIRTVYKLQENRFQFMSISDNRQRVMPSNEDRNKGQKLAYPEAVLLTDPKNPKLRGEVDDKYQYSCDNKDIKVHGWICENPRVGFWMITPSDEFLAAGPMKQDLTSHAGPTTLSMFVSTHYAGKEVGLKFRNGEPWKKVFGPVLVYLNSVAPEANPHELWQNAKQQMSIEVENWPYNFPMSEDYPKSHQRGGVEGQLLVYDRYMNKGLMGAESAYVGLAAPGEVGSWQRESKGYQFWTRADKEGRFSINNVRAGDYSLYAWIPGIIGDYRYNLNITIHPGGIIKLPNLVYAPPRIGRTLWEIGVPDRSAAEFYVPDPYPKLLNHLYDHSNKFRQYGLWERYTDLYPSNDLVYKVGTSNYTRDWFFAHVTRKERDLTYKPTTWQIIFKLDKVIPNNIYTLQLALASAHESHLEVRINNLKAPMPYFSTGMIGGDNAIARHGIHGLYWLFTVNIRSSELVIGDNTIYLTQPKSESPFQGIMYDYIRFEGPANM